LYVQLEQLSTGAAAAAASNKVVLYVISFHWLAHAPLAAKTTPVQCEPSCSCVAAAGGGSGARTWRTRRYTAAVAPRIVVVSLTGLPDCPIHALTRFWILVHGMESIDEVGLMKIVCQNDIREGTSGTTVHPVIASSFLSPFFLR
jgi:hypothetical protein